MILLLKNVALILAGLGLGCIYAEAQSSKKRVSIYLKSPELADTSRVFIAGNIPQFGMWNPSKIQMQYAANKTWLIAVEADSLESIEYKFTLGSWDREAADANGAPFQNFRIKIKTDTTVTHTLNFWKRGSSPRVVKGQITGKVTYHKQLKGEGIESRDVIVWLPPGYEDNKKERYAVLYMHDGQNIVDPATSSFGVDWQVDETCDSLVGNKIIPGMIVVGIYNTSDRTQEYTPGEKGDAYMKFVVNKLKPLIDSEYRTKKDPENTFVAGASAGGLISFMLAWEHPDVFSGAICMSPAFKIMLIDYVTNVQDSNDRPRVFFYIDNGGIDLETRLQPGVDAMLTALRAKDYVEGKDFVYISSPEARHFESDWAKRLPNAIMLLFKDKR